MTTFKIRASNGYQAELCPGSVRAQEGLPEIKQPDALRDSGSRIHAADAGEEIDLELNEEETLEIVKAKREAVSAPFRDGYETILILRETYLEDDMFTGHPDYIEVIQSETSTRSLIFDSKTGWKEQTAPEQNLQLRIYAWLQYESAPTSDIVAGLIPAKFKTPLPVLYNGDDIDLIREHLTAIWKAANAPDTPRVPGKEQCRYCRARATDRCPETIPSRSNLPDGLVYNYMDILLNQHESLLASLTPEQKGRLLDECEILEGNIAMARARLLEEAQAHPSAVVGWRVGMTKGRPSIDDAQKCFDQVSEYLPQDEFVTVCKVHKTKLVDALKVKLRALATPIRGEKAATLIKGLLDPVTVAGEGSPKLFRTEAIE